MIRLKGLIAATYTPMDAEGRVRLDCVPEMVDRLIGEGVSGLYVCGSTGEGMSLTGGERRAVAEVFVRASAGRVPVIVQVGHNSLMEAAELAVHAREIGADVVSATAPGYYKVSSVELLVDCMSRIASAAGGLPFYYYHIPVLTGVALDMVDFLRVAGERIPNLAGIKYTSATVYEFQACRELDGGRFDMLWGCDEMLIAALAVGADGAVGSTYNIAAPLYRRLIDAFRAGRLDQARQLQSKAVTMVHSIGRYPFHPAMKEVMRWIGTDCGWCRLPLPRLSAEQISALHRELERIGFLQWARCG